MKQRESVGKKQSVVRKQIAIPISDLLKLVLLELIGGM
jgi:hypothetical protein